MKLDQLIIGLILLSIYFISVGLIYYIVFLDFVFIKIGVACLGLAAPLIFLLMVIINEEITNGGFN